MNFCFFAYKHTNTGKVYCAILTSFFQLSIQHKHEFSTFFEQAHNCGLSKEDFVLKAGSQNKLYAQRTEVKPARIIRRKRFSGIITRSEFVRHTEYLSAHKHIIHTNELPPKGKQADKREETI